MVEFCGTFSKLGSHGSKLMDLQHCQCRGLRSWFFFKLRLVTMSEAQCFAPLCVLELYDNFYFYLVLRRTAPTNFTKVSGLRASSPNKL